MQRVPYNFNAQKNLDVLSKGAFLTTKSGNKINTMVIGWGGVGVLWRLPVFNVVVRQNRFTYELLENRASLPLRFLMWICRRRFRYAARSPAGIWISWPPAGLA